MAQEGNVQERIQSRKWTRKGNKSQYQKKAYNDAAINYRKALEQQKDNKTAQYNLGNALYQTKDYKGAAAQYAKSIDSLKKRRTEPPIPQFGQCFGQTRTI